MGNRGMDFETARGRYPHRYTLDHIPSWARSCAPNGKFYAPQYASDREWYENTLFPGDLGHAELFGKRETSCYSTRESWPMGQWLDAPFVGKCK